ALNAALLRAGQWLPLDPPDDGGATIGGVVAAGLSGAQAFGYGAPRQFVLGMKVALADGRAIKAGGGVVKNVAGYDMCKLFTSSRGTLGLITELTFKLRPRPAREATLVALGSHPTELIKAARSILNAQLLPVAVELLSPRLATSIAAAADDSTQALLVRFAGSEQAVEAQLNQSRLLLATDARVNVGEPADDASIWRGLAALAYRGDQCLIWRAGVRPGELPVLLGAIEEAASRAGTHINWHAGIADGRLRAFQQVEAGLVPLISMLEELRRQAQGWGGSLVVEQAPAELWQKFDPWGLGNPVVALMRRVKHQLDPEGRLAPGCFG
ncbi:MAG: FAD-binding oxidoreductase, partial [Pyrinomonadaceae bacterium]